jgi:hypothetical protein
MAVSYVEQAILRVKDQSTKPIKKINRELTKMFRVAKQGRSIPIKFTGLESAERRLKSITATIRKMPRSKVISVRLSDTNVKSFNATLKRLAARKPIVIRISATGTQGVIDKLSRIDRLMTKLRMGVRVPVGSVGGVAGLRGGGVGPRAGGPGGALGALSTTPFPGNIPTAFNIAAAYMTVRAAEITARTAVRAAVTAQSTETKTELIVSDPGVREELQNLAKETVKLNDQITISRAEEIGRDLYITGFRGNVLTGLTPTIAGLESAAIGINPERASDITLLANKMGNLAAVTEDLERAQILATGIYKAAIVQGETFSAPSLISALRIGGVAQTIDDNATVRIAASVDELGRSTGVGLQRLNKILTIPLDQAGAGGGVAKGVVESLIKAGIRGENGLTRENQELLSLDPLRFVEEVIGGIVRAQGLDPRTVEDRSEVSKLLTQMGFSTTSLRLVLNELAAGSERDRALELVSTVDPAAVAIAAVDDLGFQLKNLTKQFQSFSAEALTPTFEALAPVAKRLADILKELALAEGPGAQLKRLGFAAGVAASALALIKGTGSLLNRLNPLNRSAIALTGAATQLDLAAAALQRSAGAGIAGGQVGPRRGGAPLGGTRGLGVTGMMGFTAVGAAVGLATTDPNNTNAAFAAATAKLDTAADKFIGSDFFGGAAKSRADLEQRAREGEVSSFTRILHSFLGATPGGLPADQSVGAKVASIEAGQDRNNKQIQTLVAALTAAEQRVSDFGLNDPRRKGAVEERDELTDRLSAFGDPVRLTAALSESAPGLTDPLKLTFADAGTNLLQTFSDGGVELGAAVDDSAARFGPLVGETLLGFADLMGQRIGQMAAQSLSGVTVNARAPDVGPRLETGTQLPR